MVTPLSIDGATNIVKDMVVSPDSTTTASGYGA